MAADFRPPTVGECNWRIPGYFRLVDIEIL
jgi:hypothetical protein